MLDCIRPQLQTMPQHPTHISPSRAGRSGRAEGRCARPGCSCPGYSSSRSGRQGRRVARLGPFLVEVGRKRGAAAPRSPFCERGAPGGSLYFFSSRSADLLGPKRLLVLLHRRPDRVGDSARLPSADHSWLHRGLWAPALAVPHRRAELPLGSGAEQASGIERRIRRSSISRKTLIGTRIR